MSGRSTIALNLRRFFGLLIAPKGSSLAQPCQDVSCVGRRGILSRGRLREWDRTGAMAGDRIPRVKAVPPAANKKGGGVAWGQGTTPPLGHSCNSPPAATTNAPATLRLKPRKSSERPLRRVQALLARRHREALYGSNITLSSLEPPQIPDPNRPLRIRPRCLPQRRLAVLHQHTREQIDAAQMHRDVLELRPRRQAA